MCLRALNVSIETRTSNCSCSDALTLLISDWLFCSEGGASFDRVAILSLAFFSIRVTCLRYSIVLDTHTHTHTHVYSAIYMGTFHRRNGFCTLQTVFAIALHQGFSKSGLRSGSGPGGNSIRTRLHLIFQAHSDYLLSVSQR